MNETTTAHAQLPQLIAQRFPAGASLVHALVAENEGVQLWRTVETIPGPDHSQRSRLHLMSRGRLVAAEISDKVSAWAAYDHEVTANLDPDKRRMAWRNPRPVVVIPASESPSCTLPPDHLGYEADMQDESTPLRVLVGGAVTDAQLAEAAPRIEKRFGVRLAQLIATRDRARSILAASVGQV